MKASLYLVAAVLLTPLTSAQADCLDDVERFSDKLCKGARDIGKAGLVTGNGDLNAAAKELIAKAVGEISGNVRTETKTFEAVLRDQLAGERIGLRKCGIAMAKAAIDQTCFKASP
jgi:hypothetical protein